MLAEHTKVFHKSRVTKEYYSSNYVLDTDLFLTTLFRLKKHMAYAKEPGMLVVSYEDLLRIGPEKTIGMMYQIMEHAGVPVRNFDSAMHTLSLSQKLNKQEWSEIIENYNRLRWMFEENKKVVVPGAVDLRRSTVIF